MSQFVIVWILDTCYTDVHCFIYLFILDLLCDLKKKKKVHDYLLTDFLTDCAKDTIMPC